MFNDIGALELVTLVVLAVLVFGPDKLPKVIQDVSSFIRKVRAFSDSAKQDIRDELGPEFKDFEFEDLNPKKFIRKQLDSDELGLKEIRNGFDLRKEINDVTDAVNGTEAEPATTPAAAGRADLSKDAGSPNLTKGDGPNLGKGGSPDLEKKPANPAKDAPPPFDADAT